MSTFKPDVNKVWASNALPANIIDPDIEQPGKTEQGWLETDIPPEHTFNFQQNKMASFASHVNIEGVPVWDGLTPYILNSYCKDPSDGVIYKSLVGTELIPNLGNQPSLSVSFWRKQIETDIEIVAKPINLLPDDLSTIATQTPKLLGSRYKSLYSLPHLDSEFRVATDEAMSSLVYLSGSIGAVEEHTLLVPLAIDSDYYFDIRYQDIEGAWSNRSVPTKFVIPLSIVETPTNVSPLSGDNTITDEVTLTASDFNSLPSGGTHQSSQWQISTDVTFNTVDFDSGVDSVNLLSFTQTGLSLTSQYFWRVRYSETLLGFSDYSIPTNFITVSATVAKPINILPIDGATDINETVTLQSSNFVSIPVGDTHTHSQWQVSTDIDFSNIIFDSGEDSVNLLSISIDSLSSNLTNYFWRVRYKGLSNGFSLYSSAFTFQTSLNFADWVNWDNSTSGVVLSTQSSANRNDLAMPSAAFANIGNDRFLTTYAGSAIDWTAEVITVRGLDLARGGVSLISTTAPVSSSVYRVKDDQCIILYKGGGAVMSYRIVDIIGNNITISAPTAIAISPSISSNNWTAEYLEDGKLLLYWSGNALDPGSTSFQILNIVSSVVSTNTVLTLNTGFTHQGFTYGLNESKTKFAFLLDEGSTADVVIGVIDIDYDTDTLTVEYSLPYTMDVYGVNDFTGETNKLIAGWMSDTQVVFIHSNDIVSSKMYLMYCTYESNTLEVKTNVEIGTWSNSKPSGKIRPLTPTSFSLFINTGSFKYRYIEVINDTVFLSQSEKTIGVGGNSYDSTAFDLDEKRILAACSNTTNRQFRVLNGVLA